MCRSKHVEQLRNIGIINSTTWSHLVGYFCKIHIRFSDQHAVAVKVRTKGLFYTGVILGRFWCDGNLHIYSVIRAITTTLNIHTDMSSLVRGKSRPHTSSHFFDRNLKCQIHFTVCFYVLFLKAAMTRTFMTSQFISSQRVLCRQQSSAKRLEYSECTLSLFYHHLITMLH